MYLNTLHIKYTVTHCSTSGSRIIPLSLLCDYINQLNLHCVKCSSAVKFMGEWQRQGLNSTLISKCSKCNKVSRLIHHNSYQLEENFTSQYIRGNRGQIATGGGSAHLDEQLACVDIPSISRPHFLKLERALGTMFENLVAQGLLSADRKQ